MNNPSFADRRPLVSFVLMTYNQEEWIRDAVKAAFAQTYSPLEIVITDDGSMDRTFEIIEDEVASYKGPHRVIVNRNEINLGIASHLTKAVRMASGQLIIYACGDDVSLPQRTSQIVELWESYGGKSILIHSLYSGVDENGRLMPDNFAIDDDLYTDLLSLCKSNMFVVGCTSAYTRDLITSFPELSADLLHEDRCTPFRALLLGAAVLSIKEPLVIYRRIGVTSGYGAFHSREQARTFFRRCATDYRQKSIDARSFARADLMLLADRKHLTYLFAEKCLDPAVGLGELASALFELKPELWFAIKQIVKFRLEPSWRGMWMRARL